MRADRFYSEQGTFTNEVTPPCMMFGFRFEDFGNSVESHLFHVYTSAEAAPHRFVPHMTTKNSLGSIIIHAFGNGKQAAHTLIPWPGPFSASTIGLLDTSPYILLGNRVISANKPAPERVAKKIVEFRESERKSARVAEVCPAFLFMMFT